MKTAPVTRMQSVNETSNPTPPVRPPALSDRLEALRERALAAESLAHATHDAIDKYANDSHMLSLAAEAVRVAGEVAGTLVELADIAADLECAPLLAPTAAATETVAAPDGSPLRADTARLVDLCNTITGIACDARRLGSLVRALDTMMAPAQSNDAQPFTVGDVRDLHNLVWMADEVQQAILKQAAEAETIADEAHKAVTPVTRMLKPWGRLYVDGAPMFTFYARSRALARLAAEAARETLSPGWRLVLSRRPLDVPPITDADAVTP